MDEAQIVNKQLFDANKAQLNELREKISELKRKAMTGQNVGSQLSALAGEKKRLQEDQGKLRKKLGYKSNKKKHRWQ